MKMVSWNVNGLRACVNKGFFEFFKTADADVFCVQETKMQREQGDFSFPGYYEYWNSAERKGYSGTAVFSRKEPLAVTYGVGIDEHDKEGRVITLEFEKIFLVTVYTPNSKAELLRLDYRMTWEEAFKEYLAALDKKKPVIVCGDMNVAHKEIDLTHPRANVKNPGFTPEERNKMTELLEAGFVDTFRFLYPDKTEAYSWWSYRANARQKNVGWRIDYFLASKRIAEQIEAAEIYQNVMGSDHCPVGLILSL